MAKVRELGPAARPPIWKRVQSLVFYGTGGEAYELFAEACHFIYKLHGGGPVAWQEQVFRMAEAMAEQSREDYVRAGNDPDAADADRRNGHWG